MLKRKLGIIFATMLIFSLISYILIAAFGRKPMQRLGEEPIIVTSFYPVYIITCNLTKGVDGVRVVNLTENQTGCLHDYQLTTKDMLLLETADVLVINGGGMELFITAAAESLTGLTVIDSCEEITLIAGEAHVHEHGGISEENTDKAADEIGSDTVRNVSGEGETADGAITDTDGTYSHDGSTAKSAGHSRDGIPGEDAAYDYADAFNGHVWMDMERYAMQVHAAADGLCGALPQYGEQFRTNEEAYIEKITALQKEYSGLSQKLSGLEVITFHDAFAYLCESFGIEVVHGIDLDADTALSAGEIAEITDEIHLHGIRYLFAEEATGAIAEQIAAGTGCTVVYLDPITSGSSDMDAYLTAMRANFGQLDELAR